MALQLGKKPHAHSDYVGQHGPMVLYGLEREVDVMVRVLQRVQLVSRPSLLHTVLIGLPNAAVILLVSLGLQIEAKAKELALLQYR